MILLILGKSIKQKKTFLRLKKTFNSRSKKTFSGSKKKTCVSKVSTVTGIGRVLVAKRRTVVTFGLASGLRVSEVSTVTGIGKVLVAKRRTVVTFGRASGLRVSKVSITIVTKKFCGRMEVSNSTARVFSFKKSGGSRGPPPRGGRGGGGGGGAPPPYFPVYPNSSTFRSFLLNTPFKPFRPPCNDIKE